MVSYMVMLYTHRHQFNTTKFREESFRYGWRRVCLFVCVWFLMSYIFVFSYICAILLPVSNIEFKRVYIIQHVTSINKKLAFSSLGNLFTTVGFHIPTTYIHSHTGLAGGWWWGWLGKKKLKVRNGKYFLQYSRK